MLPRKGKGVNAFKAEKYRTLSGKILMDPYKGAAELQQALKTERMKLPLKKRQLRSIYRKVREVMRNTALYTHESATAREKKALAVKTALYAILSSIELLEVQYGEMRCCHNPLHRRREHALRREIRRYEHEHAYMVGQEEKPEQKSVNTPLSSSVALLQQHLEETIQPANLQNHYEALRDAVKQHAPRHDTQPVLVEWRSGYGRGTPAVTDLSLEMLSLMPGGKPVIKNRGVGLMPTNFVQTKLGEHVNLQVKQVPFTVLNHRTETLETAYKLFHEFEKKSFEDCVALAAKL